MKGLENKPYTREYLKNSFGSIKPQINTGSISRNAAVVIPLLYKEAQWNILLEVRSEKLKLQPGDICFPGGGMEEGEEPIETAEREICEELLIQPDQVEMIGEINGTIGPGGRVIYVFVAIVNNYTESYSREEVDSIIEIPVEELCKIKPETGKVIQTTILNEAFPVDLIPQGEKYRWGGFEREILFYKWKNNVIWGATGRILHDFIESWKQIFN